MLKLIVYPGEFTDCQIWYWVNEDDCVVSPIFEGQEEAYLWLENSSASYNNTTENEVVAIFKT